MIRVKLQAPPADLSRCERLRLEIAVLTTQLYGRLVELHPELAAQERFTICSPRQPQERRIAGADELAESAAAILAARAKEDFLALSVLAKIAYDLLVRLEPRIALYDEMKIGLCELREPWYWLLDSDNVHSRLS